MLKASKHEANLKMRSPLGSLKTTTLIGGRCTGGDVLSQAVLITRKLSCGEAAAPVVAELEDICACLKCMPGSSGSGHVAAIRLLLRSQMVFSRHDSRGPLDAP